MTEQSASEVLVGPGREAFGDGKLWIGQHEVDDDVLVFDPSEADPYDEVLSLYSLTHHRMRRFPRAIVLERIRPLSDDIAGARAKSDYAKRATLQAAHEEARSEEMAKSRQRQKEGVITAHRQYIESVGLTYEGARETGPNHRPGRRTKCHTCGIPLDDFAGSVCLICQGILCSCGVCACKGS